MKKSNRKLMLLILALVLTVSALAGCGKKKKEDKAISTTDRAGNNIEIPAKVDKIISMAPSTTRVLIDLGVADKIIAADTNSAVYADSLPGNIQYFDMMAPDNEAMIALEPDIIFTSGMSSFGGEDPFKPARDAGICVADIPSSASFKEIGEDLKFIGTAVHNEKGGQQLSDDFFFEIADIESKLSGVTDKKSVLFMLSLPTTEYPSVYTFGKGTYLDEMVTSLNAVNVTGNQEGWVAISEEEAIAMNPDVILTNVNYIDNPTDVILSAKGWENVTAIKDKAVYYIDADSSSQPNNHITEAMKEMAAALYPEVYNAQ